MNIVKNPVVVVMVVAGALLPLTRPCLADEGNDPPTMAVTNDNDLQLRVSNALHSDPYLYARHIEVSVKDGNVVLNGFVTNDWELDKAVKVATEAAKPHKVIDHLELKEGGKR
jgi:osmotically-inducible protein OsmY